MRDPLDMARDRDWCQVPGCRLTGLCPAHLHGVHAGYIQVVGVAPDRLRWSFRPGGGPAVGLAVVQARGLAAA